MAEPQDTRTWTVDASAMGQKGMHWRTHLGNDKWITRTGDAKAGFAANGETFRGCEELRGWVRNVRSSLWLPVRDIPAAGASPIDDAQHSLGNGPTGRGKQARDAAMTVIPYLHLPGCGCGGRWCFREEVPPPLVEEPRRRKPLEFVRPPAPRPVVKRPPPPRSCWPAEWVWWQYALVALFCWLLLCVTWAPEWFIAVGDAVAAPFYRERVFPMWVAGRGWERARAPPLHESLKRYFPA